MPNQQQIPTVGTDAITAGVVPVVGIGASAGGLSALEEFFDSFPPDINPGMAFVVVQHFAPDQPSILSEILSLRTKMPVCEIEDGMIVHANCVYVIPPNFDVGLKNGVLQLLEPVAARGHRLPIDIFFRSLAADLRQQAIGIILSGLGCDGIQGIKAIKGEAGLIIAQLPESAQFDSMPRNAINTGLVDYQLKPAEMPAQLISYVSQAFVKPPKLGSNLALMPVAEQLLKKVFTVLQTTTGHDFSGYKPSTIHRRIERRMALSQIETVEQYVHYLEQSPLEVDALFHDMLIGVTNFFRDPDIYQIFEQQVVPRVVDGGVPGKKAIRVWSCGCSTGEEAYSVAILLREYQEATNNKIPIQFFASDIDSRTIAKARAAIYPTSIAADISPERLARFFRRLPANEGYLIRKDIREMMVFSEHDVNKDPPFSKLDLLVCRNLLIYFDSTLQKALMPMFHFALNPEGHLWLGTSEGIGDFCDLFTTIDRRAKLFQKKPGLVSLQGIIPGRIPVAAIPRNLAIHNSPGKMTLSVKPPLRNLVEQTLLQHYCPAAAVVNSDGDILYLHGRTGMFLEPSAGEVGINNILKMAREGLRHELSIALTSVVASKKISRRFGLAVKTNGHYVQADLIVALIKGPTSTEEEAPEFPELYIVVMEESTRAPTSSISENPIDTSVVVSTSNLDSIVQAKDTVAVIEALRSELRIRDEYLLTAQEELKSSNEELKSSNEEMQAVNEELQSTNEELETSREEMQSINEELTTVNAELHSKILMLTQLNDDMSNLLAGTGIATVFVDRNLRILRFTPTVTQLINLIPTDIGRPVGHIVSNLVNYNSLSQDALAVLESLESKEMQVQSTTGNWFSMRIRPYRTQNNVIEGVVITFVDISESKRSETALAKANEQLRLAVVVRDSYDAITVQDLDGRIIAWNPSATRIYGWSEAEAFQLNIRDRIPESILEESLKQLYAIDRGQTIITHNTKRLTKDGSSLEVCLTTTALVNELGQTYAIATTERPLK